MNIKPLRDSVLVRQDPPREKHSSGLYLPSGSKELHDDLATVLAVGPKVENVKAGDRIMFARRPSSHLGEVKDEWKDLLMLKESDVVCVVEETPDADASGN